MIRVALGTALIAVGAQIKIPSPVAEYFTLQLPFVILVAITLGSKLGFYSTLIYALGGLIGIPWFASGGGFGYLIRPTFGFILSFMGAAFIAGKGRKVDKKYMCYIYAILATIFVWVYGMIHYTAISQFIGGKEVSYVMAIIAILSPDFYTDIILTVLAVLAGSKIKKHLGE
jgi:biotin transport system substrate-specific component